MNCSLLEYQIYLRVNLHVMCSILMHNVNMRNLQSSG